MDKQTIENKREAIRLIGEAMALSDLVTQKKLYEVIRSLEKDLEEVSEEAAYSASYVA